MNKGSGSDMRFLYWDDLGDSQDSVDNQKKNKYQDEDGFTEDE